MANTYSQLNTQCVFAVKGRENIITVNYRNRLHEYMAGILRENDIYPLAVGGWLDHVHVFFEQPVTLSVADIMEKVKSVSSGWINDNKFLRYKFHWQSGYGAFSYSRSQRDSVIKYIMNQERHHAKKSFRDEYLEMLKKFEIPYDEKYLFEFYD